MWLEMHSSFSFVVGRPAPFFLSFFLPFLLFLLSFFSFSFPSQYVLHARSILHYTVLNLLYCVCMYNRWRMDMQMDAVQCSATAICSARILLQQWKRRHSVRKWRPGSPPRPVGVLGTSFRRGY